MAVFELFLGVGVGLVSLGGHFVGGEGAVDFFLVKFGFDEGVDDGAVDEFALEFEAFVGDGALVLFGGGGLEVVGLFVGLVDEVFGGEVIVEHVD